MSEGIVFLLEQLNKMLPERYRVRIVACLAFIGLICFGIWADKNFATKHDVNVAVAGQVAPLEQKIEDETATEEQHWQSTQRRYFKDLASRILNVAALCSETKSPEARQLYQGNLTAMLTEWEDGKGVPFPQAVSCGGPQ